MSGDERVNAGAVDSEATDSPAAIRCRKCGKALAPARRGERFARRCTTMTCPTIWQDLTADEIEREARL